MSALYASSGGSRQQQRLNLLATALAVALVDVMAVVKLVVLMR
jgi:hypothetical protein